LAAVQTSLYTQLNVTASVFPYIRLVDFLVLWNEFKGNNTLEIEQSGKHCLHLWFRHGRFLESWWCRLFPL
jgi:hypothetical protein